MKKLAYLLFLWAITAMLSGAQFKRTPLKPPGHPNPQLYRADANATTDIQRALATATREHKHVLLDFGGNWCIDCHVLENAFHQPRIAPLLNDHFVLVHVDVGHYDKNLEVAKRYHADLSKGVPSLVVLDARGKPVSDARGTAACSTTDFERASVLSEDDVIAFLARCKPPAAKS